MSDHTFSQALWWKRTSLVISDLVRCAFSQAHPRGHKFCFTYFVLSTVGLRWASQAGPTLGLRSGHYAGPTLGTVGLLSYENT